MAYSFIFKAVFHLKDNRAGASFYEALIHFGWAICRDGGSGFIQSAWVNMVLVLYPSDTKLLREKTRTTSLLRCVSGPSSESAQRLPQELFHHAHSLHCFFPEEAQYFDVGVTEKSPKGSCGQGPGMYPAIVQRNAWLDLAQPPAHSPPMQDGCFVTNSRNNIVNQILPYT